MIHSAHFEDMTHLVRKLKLCREKVACIGINAGQRAALVKSNLSITMNKTTNQAMKDLSDVDLLDDNISGLATLIRYSRGLTDIATKVNVQRLSIFWPLVALSFISIFTI